MERKKTEQKVRSFLRTKGSVHAAAGKKWMAWLLVFAMVFSLIGCSGKADTAGSDKAEKNAAETAKQEGAADSGQKEITVNLHYLREDDTYDGWNVWFWSDGDGSAYEFQEEKKDDKGAVASITLPSETMQLGFIVRLNEWEAKDTDGDRFVDLAEVLNGTVDVYVTSGKEEFDVELGEDVETGITLYDARVKDDYQTMEFKVSGELSQEEIEGIQILDGELKAMDTEKISVSKKNGTAKITGTFEKRGDYYVTLKDKAPVKAGMPDIYSTEEFEEQYAYTGDDLGASWTKEATTFKVWAPTADAVSVNLYKDGKAGVEDKLETLEMTTGEKGVWSVEKDGDLNGVYYTYTVKVDGMENEACDPYAKSTGVNGDRAMVLDMASTDPKGWDKDERPNRDLKITDAFIYELQVRDLSSHESAGIANVGKFLGLTETGTATPNGTATGLDHIKELGITHVHLNPVFDFATVDETKLDTPQYNWGYDPKNYNVPEGSYSTDPYHGEVRVNEFKQMVQAMHENGLSVVLDVVYNHTYSGEDYCFNKIVPGYFHRINADGTWSDGSGCGNDVASERAMVSKYIVDSVTYWAREYHVDGFRFDLVGLTDVDTINAIRASLNEIDPSIIMYGEGWDMATDVTKPDVKLAIQENAPEMEGMALFSDNIRDGIKGSVFEAEEPGYVNGDGEGYGTIMKSVRGKPGWSLNGTQVINYASCHDNLTLWDKINSTNPDDTLEERIKENLLSASIVYTSQGVPFILAGEEMLRSKVKEDGTFDENSYASPDSVNSIQWDSLEEENNKMVYEFYKGLIAFRKAHDSLRMENVTLDQIEFYEQEQPEVIAYEIAPESLGAAGNLFVIYNPFHEDTAVTLPDGNWDVYVKGTTAGNEVLETVSGEVQVEAISALVLVKE